MRRIIAAILLSVTSIGANAADLARGLELFDRGEFDRAGSEIEPLAQAGDSVAQYVLGLMYLNHMVDPPSDGAAKDLIEQAAVAGHLPAQTELARMYRSGDGVAQNLNQTMFWYEKAAEQGDVGAQLFLADGYGYGYGIEPNLIESYKWYEIAIQYWGPLAVRARDVVGERMSEVEIAEAVQRAEKWTSEHTKKSE